MIYEFRRRLITVLSIHLTFLIISLGVMYDIINFELIMDLAPSKQPIVLIIVIACIIKEVYCFCNYILGKLVTIKVSMFVYREMKELYRKSRE